LICRAGRLLGADPAGRVYTGVQNPKQALKRSYFKVVGEGPHRRRSRTRLPARSGVAAVRISGEIDPSARRQKTMIFVGGKAVDIEITYLGPLPK
jgi:hypothetical protein